MLDEILTYLVRWLYRHILSSDMMKMCIRDRKYDDTLDEDTFIIKCSGAGGQSFGAFIPKGLTLELVGDSLSLIHILS